MQSMKNYILSIMVLTLLCAIVQAFFEKDKHLKSVIQFTTGLLITVCIIKPMAELDIKSADLHWNNLSAESEQIISAAQMSASNEIAEYIANETRAYILKEAAAWDVSLTVDIQLSDDIIPVPNAVTLTGNVSPYVKARLSQRITEELGISEENQLWK